MPGYGFNWRLATYAGGRGEPLHEWYPYLESYSPGFVEHVLDEMPAGTRSVLDPFGGSGATALTAAKRGLDAWYCEVNPLLQFLTATKIAVLSLSTKHRDVIVALLRDLAPRLSRLICESKTDSELRSTYTSVFSESVFFSRRTWELVLRARSVLDTLACTHPLASDLVAIAVLSALVPASLLQRAGDLRYKTPDELAQKKVDFLSTVGENLKRITDDVTRLPFLPNPPIFLCADARHLDKVAPAEIDSVVTSPPYLNGTNYFRNTKVELWFLRVLKNASDLARLRLQAVTAGICDVSISKIGGDVHPSVARVVRQVAERAYDRRIPQMVSAYFSDMVSIFRGAYSHLVPGARVIVDIGDSVYAGVHVPTDELLRDCLSDIGYMYVNTASVRKRRSRGGAELRQTLLILERDSASRVPRSGSVPSEGWNRFKSELPHQRPPFARRNWGHPLHSLCSFQGKLKPAIAHFLIEAFVSPGGKVLDPFGGVGTIPFAGALTGRHAFSFDISPAAHVIALAKVGEPTAEECNRILSRLERFVASERVCEKERTTARGISFNGSLAEYFHPHTLDEILLARRFFLNRRIQHASEALVFASLLHILHGNRPYALSRRSHPITPFAPTGRTDYRPMLPRLKEKVNRSLAGELPDTFVPGRAYLQDSTTAWPADVAALDAIVTSPPFFDSTRFYLANWMRLWLAGWDRDDFNVRPQGFVDVRQKRSFNVYQPIFRQARERLRRDGVFVMHLGQSWKCDMSEKIAEVARPWFRVIDRFSETVSHCESHGIRDKGTVATHQYLILG